MNSGSSLNSQIEAKMMSLGSGIITDLDRYLNGTDYFGGDGEV